MSDNILVNYAIGNIKAGSPSIEDCEKIEQYIEHLEQTNAKYCSLIKICLKERISRVEDLSKKLLIF